LPCEGSELFFARGLDRANHVEKARKLDFRRKGKASEMTGECNFGGAGMPMRVHGRAVP
jgi:hypothetical protein